eukprot:6189431-Pleurochrysis_carterae.AAC.1
MTALQFPSIQFLAELELAACFRGHESEPGVWVIYISPFHVASGFKTCKPAVHIQVRRKEFVKETEALKFG